jgi:hypothetical protein
MRILFLKYVYLIKRTTIFSGMRSLVLSSTGAQINQAQVTFQVFMAASMKMAVLWVVAPCNLVEVYRRFRGACSFNHQAYRDGGRKHL